MKGHCFDETKHGTSDSIFNGSTLLGNSELLQGALSTHSPIIYNSVAITMEPQTPVANKIAITTCASSLTSASIQSQVPPYSSLCQWDSVKRTHLLPLATTHIKDYDTGYVWTHRRRKREVVWSSSSVQHSHTPYFLTLPYLVYNELPSDVVETLAV